jgi:hypothetical protein
MGGTGLEPVAQLVEAAFSIDLLTSWDRSGAEGRPPSLYDLRMTDNEQFWRAIVTGDAGVMRRERRRHRRIPGAPRCQTCLVPLGGPAAPVVRLVLKRRPSAKNPNSDLGDLERRELSVRGRDAPLAGADPSGLTWYWNWY